MQPNHLQKHITHTHSPPAGRYDLHHAVRYLGGYREVASTLDRRPTWPRRPELRADFDALQAEVRAFVREAGLPREVMPSSQRLREDERGDIASVRVDRALGHSCGGCMPFGQQCFQWGAVVHAPVVSISQHVSQPVLSAHLIPPSFGLSTT